MSQRRRLSFYLEEKGYVNQPTRLTDGTFLQSIHVHSARLALEADRDSLYKNALIAYCGVYKMILTQNYSWAFVHSYYSIVYFYQALLAFNDISLCYDQGKPFSIKLTSGAQFKKEDGNTHKSILELFKDEFDTDSEICSEIDGEKVCDWFEDMRNRVNYRTVPQKDPEIDYGLCDYKGVDNLRKRVTLYLNDLDMYAYTPEHSYVAYPLLLIRRIIQLYERKGQKCVLVEDANFMKYISESIKDKKGVIAPVMELIRG